jgi:hypothetical protein
VTTSDDRDKILARRRRFFAVALASAGMTSACDPPRPCLNISEARPVEAPSASTPAVQPSQAPTAQPQPDAGTPSDAAPPQPQPTVCLRMVRPPQPADPPAEVCLSVRPDEDHRPGDKDR